MNTESSNLLDRIPKPLWYLMIMCLWGAGVIAFGLVRFNALNIDEGAAMALLLNWSVSDQIVNPVTTYGGPDFRALLFIPLGVYWSGSMIAAKVFALIFSFAAAAFLYQWCLEKQDKETALLATGIFLISPVVIYLADTMSVGPFLIAVFGAALYLDKKYRASPHTISSLYFLQMLLVAISVTLHPMGLAYPLALAWQWHKNPKSDKQKKQVWTGVGITVIVILAMQTGWIDIAWNSNPVASLHNAIMGYNLRDPSIENLAAGIIFLIPILYLLVRDYRKMLDDLMGTMILFSLLGGLAAADNNWAMIAVAFLLYRGIPSLIALNKAINKFGFMGQRGIVFFAIFILTFIFMQADKSYAKQLTLGVETPKDQLIQRLAQEAQEKDKPFLAASEWPAQTMIICKRDVVKLPPAKESGTALLESMKSKRSNKQITHIMFNHRNPQNHDLSKNIAEVVGATETLEIQQQGVIVKVRQIGNTEDKPSQPAETEPKSGKSNAEATDAPGSTNLETPK
ncbi:hypothetical protein [Kaarinaea lacus]